MKIVILGAGGVGGYFGAWLAAAGADVTFIARGKHLDAMRTNGLRVISPLGDVTVDNRRPTRKCQRFGSNCANLPKLHVDSRDFLGRHHGQHKAWRPRRSDGSVAIRRSAMMCVTTWTTESSMTTLSPAMGRVLKAPALPARRDPDVRTLVRGLSAEPASHCRDGR
jgi:hypothetical protein